MERVDTRQIAQKLVIHPPAIPVATETMEIPMRLETVQCNNCGAPLSVPESVNFVTCGHCQSQLAVKRTESVSYTEKLDRVAEQTDRLEDQVRYLAWQNQLAAIDREWEHERKKYLLTDKYGNQSEPNEGKALLALLIPGAMGLFFMGMSLSTNFGIGVLGGLAVIGIGIYIAADTYAKANALRRARSRYHARRAAITPETVQIGAQPWLVTKEQS